MLLGNGWAFLHIPKCGGTSVREALKGREYGSLMPMGGQCPIMSPWHRIPSDNLDSSLTRFTIIRHPADWIVSFWCDQKPSTRNPTYPHRFWSADPDQFALNLCNAHPNGYVSRMYLSYMKSISGVRVYRLEDGIANAIKDATGIDVPEPSEKRSANKPTLQDSTINVIKDCEHRIIRAYNY